MSISPAIQKAIDTARGSQTGAIVACAFGVERDALPRFEGKASVTSDGFVQCNFVTRDGEAKWGAFVGDYSDFKSNVEKLADHVKLSGDDRKTFAAKLNAWVGQKWSDVEPVR